MTTRDDPLAVRHRAIKLLGDRKFEEVIGLLTPTSPADPSGESSALLGLAHFHLEDYPSARARYEAALACNPDQQSWRQMRTRCEENIHAAIQQHVPPVRFFDREALLAPATTRGQGLPAPPGEIPVPSRRARWRTGLGNLLGAATTLAAEGLTDGWGRVRGYSDEVWTNWYRRPLVRAILTLSYMRNELNRRNLKNTYPDGVLTGFQEPDQPPPQGVTHFRTADGSWNNLANPLEGAAGTRFTRNVEEEAVQRELQRDLLHPNPREISLALLTRGEAMKEVPFLNLLAAAWIQFQNHGWVNHGETVNEAPLEIPLRPDDPARRLFHQTRIFVGRTQPDPTRRKSDSATLTFINEVSHWWDGSQIYGSDARTVANLRRGAGGHLRIGPDGRLPLGPDGIEETGFVRNWWVGLTMFHTLFVREHNAICDRLRAAYRSWDDNRLFNVARLVNAAVMAKIHTVEWTPAILPNRALDQALHANWHGLATNFFRSGKQRRTLAGINIRNPELGGVVGNPRNRHGQPYALTQEFVEVYRLHSLLPEELHLRRLADPDFTESIPLTRTRQAAAAKLTARHSLPDLFFSFGRQHPGQLVLNNYPRFLQELSIPGNPLYDLGAVDILRARERGVPRYNEFRRQLGLKPVPDFEELTGDPAVAERLRQVYGPEPAGMELLDLMIGTLAESRRPTGFGFGETLFQIFILNATRRLQADRFYTDSYNEETYTPEGLAWIDQACLKTVLLRHHPELATTGLANLTNAFEPWDSDLPLSPDRHPLRR